MKKMIKMMSGSRGQAAMEFLMTYGWAILVVLAAIGALAYFGVLNPSKFLPESCTLSPTSGIACLDFTVTPDSANLYMRNGGGRDLMISGVAVGACNASMSQQFMDGASLLFNVTGCDFGASGEKTKQDVIVYYTDPMSGFSKKATGTLTAKVG